MARAVDFLEVISELRVLKGFPRNDDRALLKIAEITAGVLQTPEKAAPVINRVIMTVSEWRGPSQILEAVEQIAAERNEWAPNYGPPIPPDCGRCSDTGAVDTAFGWSECDCAAGETATEHVAALNLVRDEMCKRLRADRIKTPRGAKGWAEVNRLLGLVTGEGQ